MEIKTLRVLELTEQDIAKIPDGTMAVAAAGELEMQADLIIFNGRVLKNINGPAFKDNSIWIPLKRNMPAEECHCRVCAGERASSFLKHNIIVVGQQMIVCPICGNKRCPHANDHRLACTNSNEPGQPGSAYP